MIFEHWLFALLPLFAVVAAYQGASNRLTRHLLTQHEKSAPPDGTVVITHEIELVHIVSIDELKQTMKVLVYMLEEWNDPTLAWEPAEFSGVKVTWMPEDVIWVPDLIVFNMLDHQELLHSVRSPIKIYHTGRVLFTYPAIYTVMCHIGIARFPFDDQKCELHIASWGYGVGKVVLNGTSKPLLQHYSPNEEWALQSVDIATGKYDHEGIIISELRYVVNISRKPFYYLVSLVLPSYIICMLSVAGLFARFSTRHERQERFTLGVTAILSMAVLSLVVTEKAPHSSEEVPMLVMYFHFNVIVVTIATIFTSSVMRVHIKGSSWKMRTPPEWLQKLLLMKVFPPVVTTLTDTGDAIITRHTVAEQWSELSRRMDYALAALFLIIVTAPAWYLFHVCNSMDNTTPERLLIEAARNKT